MITNGSAFTPVGFWLTGVFLVPSFRKELKEVKKVKAGHYIIGIFIETSTEKRNDGKEADYVTITTGGRKGAISVKYDSSVAAFRDYFGDCELGSTVMLQVNPSGFKDSVYYTLLNVVPVNGES